ncbi:Flp family type IVb pilin [Alteraurantiacibacter aquimixticola]|uniref:Flp family type IVb pilin n=1 Tax=Alteraurantiacibacter aquimixticola TaxID=2489173 RepID=A0A4V4U8K2_9SPHN|nr:Flp family type IVb pilin [Alteraurantiacibacter aquimixticola]TIX50263.1 Flp family type IVb pilin [Alteraurantiacibacter aquimixticola]
MQKLIQRLTRDEDGATAIEYGLIAALIAIALVSSFLNLGNMLEETFNTIATALHLANA